MDKLYRRTQILDIVRHQAVATQADLQAKLARRGVHATQATLSRDIEELGLAKTREGYRLSGGAPPPPPHPSLDVLLKEFVREVRQAANLVVVVTYPGNAHTVASALDAAQWPDVVGSVAGDDTVFLATDDAHHAAQVRKRILAELAS